MNLKLILSILFALLLSACEEGNKLLSEKWSENNAVKCTEKGNYIEFKEQGVIYSNTVVEAMLFDKPRYVVDEGGDLLIYPYFYDQGAQLVPGTNKELYLKMVRNKGSLVFENFYLGNAVITESLDEKLKNTVKLLDLVLC